MQVHLLFVNLPNFYAYAQFNRGNPSFADFPVDRFISGAWVRYSADTRLVGFFCGVAGSLMLAYLLESIGKRLNAR